MDTLGDYTLAYLEERGKEIDGVRRQRIIDHPRSLNDPLVWVVEFDIFNGHVTYTEVARFAIMSGRVRHITITNRTRLHVPITEVPSGANIFVNGEGPYVLMAPLDVGDGPLYFAVTPVGKDNDVKVLSPDTYVEVPFFYSRNEGAIAGGIVFVSEVTLYKWVADEKFIGGLDRLVGGWKFELVVVAHFIKAGQESVFDMPQ